eukprot:4048412-Prymnesium_polylepis.1
MLAIAQSVQDSVGRWCTSPPPPHSHQPLLELAHALGHGIVATRRELVGVHAKHPVKVAEHHVGQIPVAH